MIGILNVNEFPFSVAVATGPTSIAQRLFCNVPPPPSTAGSSHPVPASLIADIQRVIRSTRPGIVMKRGKPYDIVTQAAKRGRLKYVPGIQSELSAAMHDRYEWLHGVDVVHTAVWADVAEKAADTLLRLITGSRTNDQPKQDFHIGFAGRGLLRQTAQRLADKLGRTKKPLPETIFFHSMVARFDDDPATDPNSFVSYFSSPSLPVAARAAALNPR